MFSRLHGRAAPLLGAAVLSLCALGGIATAAPPTTNAPATTVAATSPTTNAPATTVAAAPPTTNAPATTVAATSPTTNAPAATIAVIHRRTISNGASGDGGAKGEATISWRKARGQGYDSWVTGSVTDTKADGRTAVLEYHGAVFNPNIGWTRFGPTDLVKAGPKNTTRHRSTGVLHHVKDVQVRWCTRPGDVKHHCGNWR